MPRALFRLSVLLASAAWASSGSEGPLVTIEQRDRLRSARAMRMVDVSADGRYVTFESWAALVPADTDTHTDIYVLDRQDMRVTLESGTSADSENGHPRISGDGRFLVYETREIRPSEFERIDIMLRDRTTGTVRSLISHQGGRVWSRSPDISDDGLFVAFTSAALAVASGEDANGNAEDVFVMQLATGQVERISVTSTGLQQPRGASGFPAINADGRIVAFVSTAPLETTVRVETASPVRQVFVRDRTAGTTTLVSRSLRGVPVKDESSSPSISGDGRFVTFVSLADNLAGQDRNRGSDVFLFDRADASMTLISRGAGGTGANGASTNPVITADGRFIAFQSDAGNLVCPSRCAAAQHDLNLLWDIFVFDRMTGTSARMSEDELGGWMEWSAGPAIDASGRVLAFSSRHPIDGSDRRDDLDLFVRQIDIGTPTQPKH